MWKGFFYMLILVVINLLKTLLTSQHIYQLAIMGLRIRSALTSSLFKKALTLNPKARQEQTSKLILLCITGLNHLFLINSDIFFKKH